MIWPFNSKPGAGLVCPRCEKPLEGHDEAACVRRMSRRYFFGAMAGGAVLAAAGPELMKAGGLFNPSISAAQLFKGGGTTGNKFLTVDAAISIVADSLSTEWVGVEFMQALSGGLRFNESFFPQMPPRRQKRKMLVQARHPAERRLGW